MFRYIYKRWLFLIILMPVIQRHVFLFLIFFCSTVLKFSSFWLYIFLIILNLYFSSLVALVKETFLILFSLSVLIYNKTVNYLLNTLKNLYTFSLVKKPLPIYFMLFRCGNTNMNLRLELLMKIRKKLLYSKTIIPQPPPPPCILDQEMNEPLPLEHA